MIESARWWGGGRAAPKEIDVRFLAATNLNLGRTSAQARFRRDLYFRLNGMTLAVTPLRRRPADITRARCRHRGFPSSCSP